MNKFKLSSAFHIGHKKIDSDHVTLVAILNDMVDDFNLGNLESCQINWTLFYETLKQHFIDEEKIMADVGFVEDNHGKSHEANLKQIEKMGEESSSLTEWKDCLYVMRDHLLSRVLKHDLKFAEYLVTIAYNGE